MRRVLYCCFCLVQCIVGQVLSAQSALVAVELVQTKGTNVDIMLSFDGRVPVFDSYSINDPAQIVLDLGNIENRVSEEHLKSLGILIGIAAVSQGNKTRFILKFSEPIVHEVYSNKRKLIVSARSARSEKRISALKGGTEVLDVNFSMGQQQEALIQVKLLGGEVPIDVERDSGNLKVMIPNAFMRTSSEKRLDVTDFATIVRWVDIQHSDSGLVLLVQPREDEDFSYLVYQDHGLMTISVQKVIEVDESSEEDKKKQYTGERLSLDFQDIEVRTVLKIIADFTGMNLVVNDEIKGSITLRLKNVPWDQALDVVLNAKALGKKIEGNVLRVAPAAFFAYQEDFQLNRKETREKLATLKTEIVRVQYAKAEEIVKILGRESKVLTDRGSVVVDKRTNSLMVLDTVEALRRFRSILKKFDVPVRQIMIEARVAFADRGFTDRIGISVRPQKTAWNILNWGIGTDGMTSEAESSDDKKNAAYDLLFNLTNQKGHKILELELSALELESRGEVVAQPRIITITGQSATIKKGVSIPFQSRDSDGTKIEYKEAVLMLQVTPQVTPGNHIILDLDIKKDEPKSGGTNPTIDRNSIKTQVSVENGQTIVMGGVFESSKSSSQTGVPFLAKLPAIGILFKDETIVHSERELLIFVTPKIIEGGEAAVMK